MVSSIRSSSLPAYAALIAVFVAPQSMPTMRREVSMLLAGDRREFSETSRFRGDLPSASSSEIPANGFSGVAQGVAINGSLLGRTCLRTALMTWLASVGGFVFTDRRTIRICILFLVRSEEHTSELQSPY